MINVVIRAPLLSISGYGVHCRQVFNWLDKKENINITSQIVQWGNTSWMVNPDMEDGLVSKIISTSNDSISNFDISFQVQLPDEWDPNLAKKNIGISAVVETDRCNPQWIDSMNKMDAVIVPSTYVRDIILKTGNITTKLFVIPEWYHEEIDRGESKSLNLDFETDFNFLTISQFTGNDPYTDRKNLYFTIKWFCEAFSDDPSVGLVLKTNHGRGTHIDRQITKNKIRQLVSEVRRGPYPKIHLLHGNLSAAEVVGLYSHPKIKCFLTLTRGEGFGLPILEASACELPVMATNWSAHLDFLNLGKFIPINYKMIEIPENKVDNRIFLQNMRWAEPIEEDFKKKVLKLRNKYSIPEQWAKELSKSVKSKFSASAITLMYDNMLNELMGLK
jgi:glycosyltransferase involved in cell wall biosynthesis